MKTKTAKEKGRAFRFSIKQYDLRIRFENMTATLTYTLVLAAIYFGIKAMEVIEQKD